MPFFGGEYAMTGGAKPAIRVGYGIGGPVSGLGTCAGRDGAWRDGGSARRTAGGSGVGERRGGRRNGSGGAPPTWTVTGRPACMPAMICPHRITSSPSSGQSHPSVELCSRPHASAIAPAIA